jgi:hypothetical protein
MALVDNAWYLSSVGYTAVTAWATGASIAAGALRRPTAATAGNERVFVCVVAGTTHATTEPTWVNTRGAKNTDNTVTWQECTGIAALNGDATSTPTWTITATPPGGVKNTAVTLGQVIKRDNGASYQICTTAGTAGNGAEPAFSNTAGTTTADNTVTWTSLGAVGNFTGGQAPHARITSALTTNWTQAGNTVYLKSDHAETLASGITLAGAGTAAAPLRLLCHNGAAYPPAAANLTTGASITTSGGTITLNHTGYAEGIAFVSSAAANNVTIGSASALQQRYKNCTFTRGSTTGAVLIGQAASGITGTYEFDNCSCSFANVNNTMGVNIGKVIWKNSTMYAGAAVPTNLFAGQLSGSHVNFELHGVDFSAAGSGKTIFPALTTMAGTYKMINCKLNAAVTLAATPSVPNYRVEIINCDSGAVNYRNEIYDYAGTLTTETTIVRTGGATDGTTPISWKVITTANARFEQPFECPPIAIWNDGSATTATIECISASLPTDADIWVEFEYLGSSATPLSSFVSDAKATVLTTAASQTTSSETWGGSTTEFKLHATIAPDMEGFVYARVKVGAAALTVYVDPKITLS